MQPVRQLVRIAHGSHLYGTSTPASDQDFKGVHLPSGAAIVLQRAENVINTSVVAKDGTKNTADAIDSDSYSVQKFLEMLTKGDTVATEILFAPFETCDPLWLTIQQNRHRFLNRQVKGFVGYCVRQAAKYGIKGSRMAAVRGVLDMIDNIPTSWSSKMGVVEQQFRKWSEGREHVSWENIPNPNGSDNWHLNVCDRKISMNVHVAEARRIWSAVWENYGDRARQAMTNEGIDWKAVSHAVRVAGQAIELLDTGTITFPRPDADWLLAIKRGERPYNVVSQCLEQLVAEVHVSSENSKLPEKSDHKFIDKIVTEMYLSQLET